MWYRMLPEHCAGRSGQCLTGNPADSMPDDPVNEKYDIMIPPVPVSYLENTLFWQ